MVIDRLEVLKKRILEINCNIKKIRDEDQVELGKKIDQLTKQVESICIEYREDNDIFKMLILNQQISLLQDKYIALREEWTKNQKKIDKYLDSLIEKRMQNPKVQIYNNYREQSVTTDLLSLIDTIHEHQLIIGGGGYMR